MKRMIIFLIVLLSVSIFAQEKDTLHFFNNNDITLKVSYLNINSFYPIKLVRINQNSKDTIHLPFNKHIRKTHDIGLEMEKIVPKNSGFIGEIYDNMDDRAKGSYQYVLISKLTNIVTEITDTIEYFVKVDYLKLASPDVDRDTLFLGENYKFSIAALGLSIDSLYSYKVMNSTKKNAIKKGKGNFVDLTDILTAKDSDGYEKKYEGDSITVTGNYNGKPFKYVDDKNVEHNAEWSFKIVLPEFGSITRWTKDEKILDISNESNLSSTFWYEGIDNGKSIIICPNVKRVWADADNDETFTNFPYKNYPLKGFTRLNLDNSEIESFASRLPYGRISTKTVSLSVKMQTRFKEETVASSNFNYIKMLNQ